MSGSTWAEVMLRRAASLCSLSHARSRRGPALVQRCPAAAPGPEHLPAAQRAVLAARRKVSACAPAMLTDTRGLRHPGLSLAVYSCSALTQSRQKGTKDLV